jgi:crotonobetainyl-CoA:carnitine CoA-transferase CaiB-like acyl-CoA transferase
MNAARPLEGIRVLDFSWVWSGPLVAGVLAEFGAEVIKVEHGQRLDNSRLRGKPLRDGQPVEGPSIETGPYFHQTNHDKLSITLNLKAPQARQLLHRLAAVSHVVVENLSPGALARAGMGYEEVAAINPRIIYLSMSAAGQTGPSSGMRAYAPIMSSYCGFEALVGYPDEPPIGMMNFGYGDPNAAVHALVPLLAALLEAEETGRGQQVDMSQIEALLSVAAEPLIDYAMNRREGTPSGNRHPAMAPHGIYPAAGDDAWVSIAVADDVQWEALLDAMGRPAGCDRSDWRTARGRLAQREAIDAVVAAWTASRPAAELAAALRARGIACSPVLDVPGQWADPHYQARGIRQKVVHPISGEEWLYRAPWRMERHPAQVRRSAPLLGEHNRHVFGTLLGLPDAEIDSLMQSGVIA